MDSKNKILPKISIIVPVHNSVKTLEKCSESILNQTYTNIELILVNNGSVDDSLKLAKEISENDNRVKVFDEKKSGVSLARNIGLENATGEYFSFVDADDAIDLTYCEKMLNVAQKKDADMTFCKIKYLLDSKEEIRLDRYLVDTIGNKRFDRFLPNHRCLTQGSSCRVLYKSCKLKSIRFNEDLKIYEDLIFLYDCLIQAETFGVVDEELYFYDCPDYDYFGKYYDKVFLNNCEAISKILPKQLEELGYYEYSCAEKFACYEMAINAIRNKSNSMKDDLKYIKNSEKFKQFNCKKNYICYKKSYCKSIKRKVFAFFLRRKAFFIIKILFNLV